jgi:hypothetical protein
MKTDCSERTFEFEGPSRRKITARFDGGTISSDGGALLLHETERRTRIVERFAACFEDHRDPVRIEHSLGELVSQRVFGLCLGYEDLSDHEALRSDPLLCALAGKHEREAKLAGKSTLSRLELSTAEEAAAHRYKKTVLDSGAVDRLLVDVFVESFEAAPESIVIDLDSTDFAIHGHQEGRFFHGYYDQHCYLPLYIFSGDHLLCARLRRSDIDGAAGSLVEIERIVAQIRVYWPLVKITLRADSGFCREAIMAWCEASGVDYVLGLARNDRLVALIQEELGLAQMNFAATGEASRVFKELDYCTLTSWTRSRRVVAKAEHLAGKDNPRFVVTSLSQEKIDARALYEDLYCARGEMENRIKEQQLDLFAGRVSAQTIAANQVRLYFASIGYTLMHALRRLGLEGTALARAQCGTIRLKLLKIGAQIRVSVRRVWVALSEAFPLQELFAQALTRLRVTNASTG